MSQRIFNEDWNDKYKPKSISDLFSNKNSVIQLDKWLKEFEQNKKKSKLLKDLNKKKRGKKKTKNNEEDFPHSTSIVIGKHGVGKTVSVEVVLKENNYNVISLDMDSIKNDKSTKISIEKLIRSNNILDLIGNKKPTKSALVIDEIESITSTTEKKYISELQKLNDEYWYCPIIFISNGDHNKLLTDLKSSSLQISIYPPSNQEMRKIFLKIAKGEKLMFSNVGVIEKIMDHSQSDIRRLIYILQDIKYEYGQIKFTDDIIDEYCFRSKKKDIDIDLFTATKKIFYNYENIGNCIRYYETEKVLLPLMIHQNYIDTILVNYPKEQQIDLIYKISNSLALADVVENYIYGDQNWDMQEIHGYHTCVAPSFYLSQNLPKDPIILTQYFAKDLNRTSIKKINKKNINNTNICFKNMNIFDYIYINKIIKRLIAKNQIEECIDLLKDYDIKFEHIESLLKIDKITEASIKPTGKQKKEFLKFLKNPE